MVEYTPSRRSLVGVSIIPVLGIALSWVVETGVSSGAEVYGPLMLIGYLLSYFGTGVVFFLWARFYRQRGRPAVGDSFVRGIFLVMASFVGWSLVLKYLSLTVSSVAILEALIVATATAGTGILILWATGRGSSILLSKSFGLTLGLASLVAYMLYLVVSKTVTVYTMAVAIVFSIIVGRHLVSVIIPAA